MVLRLIRATSSPPADFLPVARAACLGSVLVFSVIRVGDERSVIDDLVASVNNPEVNWVLASRDFNLHFSRRSFSDGSYVL